MSSWDPAQYNRFAAEREQPFWDLAALLAPTTDADVVDLGCGDGRLTAALAAHLGASVTLGIDTSEAMLAAAAAHAGSGVSFERGDIARWCDPGGHDVVFSNAALQWVPDHPSVLARWVASLRPGGQLAVQMPANGDHPSHTVARALAEERLGPSAPPDSAVNVAPPEVYAAVLHRLGVAAQHVRVQVYGHVLESSEAVVEWVKGTTLTRIKAVLDPDAYADFVEEYRQRLLAELGEQRPYFYPFKRLLIWAATAP